MRYGVVYPQIEMKGDPENVRQFARALEELRYDHILIYDHVLGAEHSGRDPPLNGPYDENDPFHDPFTMLAYLAGLTTRLELVTGVLVLPQRQTAIVAKQAADLSLFSGERFRMGVGAGWNWVEYQALGVDFKSRGARMDEQIPLLRRLWSERMVTHQGRFEPFERASLVVAPKAPIPIWMGGFSEPAFRRAGRLGDGFIFAGTPDPVPGHWERVAHHLREAGRDEAAFGRELIASQAKSSAVEIADALKRWRDAGHTHGSFQTMRRGFADVRAHIDFIAEVKRRLD